MKNLQDSDLVNYIRIHKEPTSISKELRKFYTEYQLEENKAKYRTNYYYGKIITEIFFFDPPLSDNLIQVERIYSNSKITRQREDFSLNLRKEKLFNYIMEKRLNKTYDQINRDMEINLENLNISGKIKELFQIIVN
jgi:hypothetical protein